MKMSRRNKRDVDRYVSQIPEKEKNNRGYQIAVLYHEAGEQEIAKRFLASYISTKEAVPQAHKLMGQILEASNNKEQAITSYRRSLELDSKQKDLILKICELYCSLKTVDKDKLKYWIEQAERFHPNNSVVFKMKERVMSGNANFEDMEDFYAKQLERNYTDVNLHIKLLELYLREDKVGNAFRHTVDVEKTLAFADNLTWYENVTRIFHAYQKRERCQTDTSFHTHRLIVLCNLVYLQIKEKEVVSCAQSLYMLDQTLMEALSIKSQKPEWTSILSEVQGMYYFLCGLLLLKRANKGQLSWKDASSFTLVCFLLSNSYPVINKTSPWYMQSKSVQLHKFYDRVYLFGCYRLSQTGYLVKSLLKGEAGTQLNAQKQQLRTPQARDKLYDVMFTMREMREKKGQSYLIQSGSFSTAQIMTPSKEQVAENDPGVQQLFADNLQQLVWLALQKFSAKDQVHPDYGMNVYNKFQFSADNIDGSSLESLCQLDIQAFFIAAVRCASISYESQQKLARKDMFKPYILPTCLCPNLCTSPQTDWWTAMYKFCIGKAKENFPKLRSTLQRGLEVIRAQGTHGLSVVTITNIARTFDQRSKELVGDESVEVQNRVSGYNSRAALYWKEAVDLLDKFNRNVSQRIPKDRMFDDGDQGLVDQGHIKDIKDQATFSLATVAMRSGQYEEAKAKFETVKTPWATYYLAKIYRNMSEQINSDETALANERLTLMERALDTLYLTLDRLKTCKNHDLEMIVPEEIDEVVNELDQLRTPGIALVDSICNGMNGLSTQQELEGDEDEESEEEYASFNTPKGRGEPVLPTPALASPNFVASTPAYKTKTPSKSPGSKQLHFSMEVNQRPRPSPERLEARIWALEKKQETMIDLVQDMKTQSSELKQAVKDLKDENGDLIRQVKELVISQRAQQAPMYPSPYAGSLYGPPPPPPRYPYQPTPPLMSQSAYGYPMPMSPGPGGRPIPSRISRGVNQYAPGNEIDDEYYEGEFYEDDGSGQGIYGQDTSGWTVNHKPGFEGVNNMSGGQPLPPAGFFANALRGQALQFQQGQLLAGQTNKQGSPMMNSGILSMSSAGGQGLLPSTQQQPPVGMVPNVLPVPGSQVPHPKPAVTVPGMFPSQPRSSDSAPKGQLAELLASDTSPKRDSNENKSPLISKPPDVQRQIFGATSGTPTFGNVSSSTSTPNTMPILSSLMAASTSPDKPMTNPVSMVTSAQPKGTITFGKPAASPASTSPFNFGQISPKPPGSGINLFTSPAKVSSTTPGVSIFSSPQKDVIAGNKSREATPNKSPSKIGEDHLEEYEPNVDFKPVIDLPDLVETKTGEEDEEVMFCERSKLFRFVDGQWKERGTGEMKLLRHRQTNRVRVLMRREQVLKVCANHFLSKEMKLSPLQSSKNAWCWNAQDFSEGEIKMEKLAVRFKDQDIALRFKTTFEKLQSELDKVVQPKKETTKPTSSNQPSLGSLFKTEAGSWKCDACLVPNKADVQKCLSCGTLKPGVKPEDVKQPEASKGPTFSFGSTTGGFKLGNTATEQKPATGLGFTFQSGPSTGGGFKFGETTVTEKTKTEVAKPDSTTTGGFKFGQTTSTPAASTKTTLTDMGKPPLSAGFTFGQTDKKGFSFGQTDTKPGPTSTVSTKATSNIQPSGFSFGTSSDSSKDKPASTFTFKPTVNTEASTKENKPATTFSFKPSAQLPTTTTTTQKSATISKPEATKKDEKKGFGDLFKVKEGSWKCNGCLMSNTGETLKCPACETLKPGVSKEAAKAAGFGSSAGSAFGKKDEKKGFGDLFKTKEGSWKCDGCLMNNNSDVLKCPACESLKPGVKKEDLKDTGKSVFGSSGPANISFGSKGGFSFGGTASESKPASGFNFSSKTADATKDSAPSGFSFTPSKDAAKDKTDSKPTTGFTFTSTTPASDKNKPTIEAKGFDFTMPSSKSETPQKSSSGFDFSLSPTKAGPAGAKSPATDTDGMYVNKEGEDDHIYFEPVIELPSMVDVVTGEEEEEILFQHRAKLFRFVNSEWKERGLGDIKISKHKETGKVRLLMRREQILKICLNHYLSKELELKPMAKSDGKAWVWFAMDFSENEPEMQQLAVKFKNQEIAANFKKAFDNAKDKLQDGGSTDKSPVKSEAIITTSPIKDNEIVFVKEEKATQEQIEKARKFKLPDHFYLYESKPPCPGCIGCEDYQPGKKCSPPKARGKAGADKTSSAKPSVFGQSSSIGLFGQKSEGGAASPGLFGSSDTSSSSTDVKGGVFGGSASGGFSFSSLAKQTDTASSEGEIFGGGGVSFSELAKQADNSTSPGFKVKDDNKQFSWSGTGQKLFSGGGDGEDGDEDADESGATYDPHYEPIIDLPDLVDVKTGEEDYDKLFCERSKLFRFDRDTNQWKEKGLGEMKILQHKENKRYRLILRREQVLKIACNQWLTPDISFKPLQTSETSWCWVGQDFSDYEPVVEQLAIKFKTIELAQQFKQVIDRCQEDLRQRQAATTERGVDADKIPTTINEGPTVNPQVAPAQSEQEVDQEEEEYDDDEDYTTEEEEILFDKRIKFFSKETDWKAVGLGTLKVIYDDDVNGNRIMVELDNKEAVCNHLVAKESNLNVNKKECEWSPIDFSTDDPVRRHFRAQFSSEQAALEFQKFFLEGRQLAVESDISERNMVTYPREITFPVGHGGSSQ